MEVLEITSRQFREKQRSFFDVADTGKRIIIKRGRKTSYALTPIQEKDIVLSPEALKRIDEAAEQIKRGDFVIYTPELEQQLLGNYV
jgi:PHD/YefM family antitoxin component YafN of YafNO toxin-antitoxin module